MGNEHLSAAAVALKVWQAENGLNNKTVQDMLGMTGSDYSAIRAGRKNPGPKMRVAINRATGGAVDIQDWDTGASPAQPSKASEALRNWRAQNKLTVDAVASVFGVSRQIASYYINGRAKPSPDRMAKIEDQTDGAVAASAWSIPYATDQR